MPADQPPVADHHGPTAADVAAVRAAVGRHARFFVLLLASVILASASLAGLRWAANTTPAPAGAATGR
ncbi:hypothetical protein [Kitasatospora sp. NPDC059571]|uniref:hypothetical protein n=1 Tax=Kitasatospora sp. NPDC059571 TaxID=3346871 RepID=UPI0036B5D344